MPLSDCTILVVEDDYLVGMHIADVVSKAGGKVVGPFTSIIEALENMSDICAIDGAVLDVHLGDDMSFPLAEALSTTRIPFLFLTGCQRNELPQKFDASPYMMKPFTPSGLVQAILDFKIAHSNR